MLLIQFVLQKEGIHGIVFVKVTSAQERNLKRFLSGYMHASFEITGNTLWLFRNVSEFIVLYIYVLVQACTELS